VSGKETRRKIADRDIVFLMHLMSLVLFSLTLPNVTFTIIELEINPPFYHHQSFSHCVILQTTKHIILNLKKTHKHGKMGM
jgi:hypothetical protein